MIKKTKEEKKEKKESKENLEEILSSYKNTFQYSSVRMERLDDLLSRDSSKKWSKKKKEKMIRRFLAAKEDTNISSSVVDQVEFRMSQIIEER